MENFIPTIAIITFTDDRDVGVSSPEVENYLKHKQSELKNYLSDSGIDVIDPLAELRKNSDDWYGVRKLQDINNIISILSKYNIDGIIIGAWTWSPPMLIMEFIRKIARPFMYYTENNPLQGNLSQFSAACSSLMEWGVNKYALTHERNFGNRLELVRWSKTISAVSKMRESALLLWGGTYAVKMEQLQDDVPKLKSFLIRDILSEDQYILVNRAEKIINNNPGRIDNFIKWVTKNGLKINYDGKMLTEIAFKKQIALLIAARDRLEQLKIENINGVSIKCQPEIYFEYGVNACTLPAFLPFSFNEEGRQKIYPTVCEGDIKGLLTSMILYFLNPSVPPSFGDLISAEDDYIEFANCGAGSIFWAANSNNASEALSNTRAVGNIHGVSGAAFSYSGKESSEITVSRLTRIKGDYYLQFGTGKALDSKSFLEKKYGKNINNHLGQTWGKVTFSLNVKAENFVKVIGANHLSATLGNHTEELEIFCRQTGIKPLRIDSNEQMEKFYNEIRLSM
jgi:L-fucose isomerase-like protein